ncbi:MAG: hypothetical protein IPH75_01805 [bacterium]|nr:hypothetical protein [bacterium]
MKKHEMNSPVFLLTVALVLVSVSIANAISPGAERKLTTGQTNAPVVLSPAPATIDQILHNMGNIVTTIDNAGYVGGYSHYGLASGEWPRNSGHDYLAEIKYWMGGIAPNGDTLVANTWDEFQAVQMIASGAEDYRILLSTDTTRYYQYDPSDTVGLGKGNPAFGWRVFDPESETYEYTDNFNPLDSTFYPGGPLALQQSHYVFNDAAGGTSLMGLSVTHTMLQWNYCYNEDISFVILEITNNSAIDYSNFTFGLYADFDIGGPDGTGENGRLGDVVEYDVAENLAWTYDLDGFDPGWGPTVTTGMMGTKLLETPDNIGMTGLRTGEWEQIPSDFPTDDIPRFELMNAAVFDDPLPPTDQYYIQCTRGIDLTAGKTVRVVYALVAGQDEEALRANSDRAQALYDKHFVGPQPPVSPTLMVRAGDRKVYLSWNDTAEVSIDPLSGVQDFSGYKLYRSDNQGKTWGQTIYSTGNSCLTTDFRALTTYRVEEAGDPIPHSYVDTGLYNGIEYWYCLSAFDLGDSTVPVDVLQTGFGSPEVAPNVIRAVPSKDPAGYYEAAGTVVRNYTGTDEPSAGSVYPLLFNRDSLNGPDYQVVFEDTPQRTYWHLINVTTGDTLLGHQTRVDDDPGYYEVIEGLRVVVRDGDREPEATSQTSFAGSDTTLAIHQFYGPSIPNFTGNPANAYGGQHFRSNYELRYTGNNTVAPSVIEYWTGDPRRYDIPFEVWNTSTNERVSLAIYDNDDDGAYQPYDLLTIVNYPYDESGDLTGEAFPYYYSWMFDFDEGSYAPSVGDVYTIEGAPLNSPQDVFAFKIDGISSSKATRDLAKIKVVPDPYFAQYSARVETGEGESIIEFQNVPSKCTIRIYTLSGDLVQTLEHDSETGTARWNLQSTNQQLIASGIYIFHVDSPYGERLGRFAIIK